MEQPEGSYVRWQSITITQLGYVINLILTLAAASLGFTMTLVRDEQYNPGCWGKCFWIISASSLLASIGVGIWCAVNRLRDFRKTRKIARDREQWKREGIDEGEIDRRLESRRNEVRRLGDRTWTLFYWQIGFFACGIVAVVVAFAAIYRAKLF